MGEQFDYVNGGWYKNYEDGNNEQSDNYYGSPEMLRLNVLKTTDKRFTNLTTEKEDKIDAATGEAVSDTSDKTFETSFVDFQQDEYDFTKNIESKYDLSDYIIKDAKGQLFPFNVLGIESFANAIEIFDKRGNKLASFRTNYTDEKKAQDAAGVFNKFLIDNNIQLKESTDKVDELYNKYVKGE